MCLAGAYVKPTGIFPLCRKNQLDKNIAQNRQKSPETTNEYNYQTACKTAFIETTWETVW